MHELRGTRTRRVATYPVHFFMQLGNTMTVMGLFRSHQRTLDMAQFRIPIEHVFDGGLIGGRGLLRDMGHYQTRLNIKIAGILVQFAQ